MSKKELSYLFGILLGVVFLLSVIKGIYIEKTYNLVFLFLGLSLVLLNAYLLLNKNK